MADVGGSEVTNNEKELKSSDVKSDKQVAVVRRPSRRSPTTGHRRKKTDFKRSQSTPREAIVPTSSDDEAQRSRPRRKSLSPDPGTEPKKVLRKRHRLREKSQEAKEENIPDPGVPKENVSKSPISEKKVSKRSNSASRSVDREKSERKKDVVISNTNKEAEPKKDDKTKLIERNSEPKVEIDSPTKKVTTSKVSAEKAELPVNAESSADDKTKDPAKPNSWWGGWSPFKRKSTKTESASEVEATGDELEPPKLADYVTTDDEVAAEFVKILTQTKHLPKKEPEKLTENKIIEPEEENYPAMSKTEQIKSWGQLIKESRVEFAKFRREFPREVATIKKLTSRCFCELLIVFILCGCGAFVFKTTEGAFESFYKCGVKRVKRDFIDDLWRSSHFMKEDDWKSKARRKLWEFENQLQEAFDAGMTSYSGLRSWTFINGIIYCLTVITTIGYGHIAPVTNSGRALTIAYSIIGIPLFLILLADFGKLFTRGIKFLWAFVRRLYYTGSCKKVRRTGPVQEVMKGMQMVYETIRRPSMFPQEMNDMKTERGEDPALTPGEPPSTPALSTFAIDDEFNLPISVAITVLLVYIFLGATVFWIWEEEWTFFEAFYFVFISMSTIGFGDLVPKNQMYMMASIVYLAFGLALTSMCINVVQEKLSDTFRKASAKIGATIGLKVSEDDGTISPISPTHVEIAEVHKPTVQMPLNFNDKES